MIKNMNLGGCENINDSYIVKAVAKDRLQIGDVVQTVDGIPESNIVNDCYHADVFDEAPQTSAFSPNGSLLVIGGMFTGYAKLYSVNGQELTYLYDIPKDNSGASLVDCVNSVAFSPDGTLLVLGCGWYNNGSSENNARVYSVNETTLTYLQCLYSDSDSTLLSDEVYSVSFSPDGSLLVIGGYFEGYAKKYSVSGTTISYIGDILDADGEEISECINTCCFSPDGTLLFLGGDSGIAWVYSVNNQITTYSQTLYADSNNTAITSNIQGSKFSPDGALFVMAYGYYFKIYTVANATISYLCDLPYEGTATEGNSICFSPDSKYLIASQSSYICSINGTEIEYVYWATDFYGDAYTHVFFPDGKAVLIGGESYGYGAEVEIHAFNGELYLNELTYQSTVYMNTPHNSFSGYISAVAFSHKGDLLVLGGSFYGGARLFAVDGTTLTYLQDVPGWSSTASMGYTLTNVWCAAFSPDDTLLTVGGSSNRTLILCSVEGKTLTFLSDMTSDGYANTISFSKDSNILFTGSTNASRIRFIENKAVTKSISLNKGVYASDFSPLLNNMVVVGGTASSNLIVYTINESDTVSATTYYADNNGTAFSFTIRCIRFSPDGKQLVVCGDSGKMKLYSVSGTTLTYIKDFGVADSSIQSISFTPEGDYLIAVGDFTGTGHIYFVNNNEYIYERDVLNESNEVLNESARECAVSPDGSQVIIGGDFNKYCILSTLPMRNAYLIENNVFSLNEQLEFDIGFSKQSANQNEIVKIKTVAQIYGLTNSSTMVERNYLAAGDVVDTKAICETCGLILDAGATIPETCDICGESGTFYE